MRRRCQGMRLLLVVRYALLWDLVSLFIEALVFIAMCVRSATDPHKRLRLELLPIRLTRVVPYVGHVLLRAGA
jgi:hypothetical protein